MTASRTATRLGRRELRLGCGVRRLELPQGLVPSRWRDRHFAEALSPSLLKRLLKVEGGAAERLSRRWLGVPRVEQRLDALLLLLLRPLGRLQLGDLKAVEGQGNGSGRSRKGSGRSRNGSGRSGKGSGRSRKGGGKVEEKQWEAEEGQ